MRHIRKTRILRGLQDFAGTKDVMGILHLRYRVALEPIRRDLIPRRAAIKVSGNRQMISTLGLEEYILSRRVQPVPVKPRTDSIWMGRTKRRGAPVGRTADS